MQAEAFRMGMWRHILSIKAHMDKVFGRIVMQESLTVAQAMALLWIHRGSVKNVGSLGRLMQMGQANASTLCKKLEKDGLLRRIRDEKDERVVRLTLTENGERVVTHILACLEGLDRFIAAYPPEKLQCILTGFEETEIFLQTLQAMNETCHQGKEQGTHA